MPAILAIAWSVSLAPGAPTAAPRAPPRPLLGPPPVPKYYAKLYHAQPADHFNAENHETFRQLYLLNATWWAGPGAPIVLYTGAEGSGIESIFAHSGWVLHLARELKAMAVFAEMRFFGESQPFVDPFEPSPRRLGLLSVEQALADYAALVNALRDAFAAWASPVVAVGGSLAGTLAFLLRAKYPSVASAALASSAPILGYVGLCDEYGWYRVATSTFEKQAPGCPAMVRAAFASLLRAAPAEVTKAFNTCSPATPATAGALAAAATDQLAALAESAYPRSTSPVVSTCAMIDPSKGVGALAPVLSNGGACINISLAEGRPRTRRLNPLGGVDHPDWAARAWLYIACTEVVHPISSNNVTDMFPSRRWSLPSLSAYCNETFGVTPRAEWLPETMGMSGGAARLSEVTSRVIFTNGRLDPWFSQSVTANVSDTIVAINIDDGAHHSDLGSPLNPWPSTSDSPSLQRARQEQLALLRQWLGVGSSAAT